MRLRQIPDDFDAAAVCAIDGQLSDIELVHGVKIALAIESGSRAWGFPSPDSDYDCRFVFVRPVDQHLSPWSPRDVIETPPGPVLDLNGWEIGKALKLLLKGNAVIIEWLQSPIVYGGDAAFRAEMLAFALAHSNRTLIGRHHLHLGENQRRTYFGDGKNVPLKKLFYALRPAATLRWLRLRPREAIAPMHFPTLMAECDPPRDVDAIVSELIARKAITRELGSADLPEPIRLLVDDEFARARAAFAGDYVHPPVEAVRAAELLFRACVHRWSSPRA